LGFTQKGRFEFITSCREGEGVSSGDTTSRLAEIVAGVELARQRYPQKQGGEEGKESEEERIKKLKKELGYKG